MITVVGIGPGNIENITLEAKNTILASEVLIGGKRNIELACKLIDIDCKDIFYLESNFKKMNDFVMDNIFKKICIVASGESKLYGIADYIEKNFSKFATIKIVSGISSVQYFFSKIGINMNDIYITSSHGRIPDYDFIFKHNKISMLSDNNIGPKEIACELLSRNLDYTMYIGENLSYEDECITIAKPDEILKKNEYKMAVIVLLKEGF